jgi:hypothetical protein
MKAAQLGELLLRQAVPTWDERELEYSRDSGGIYFLAQLLRSKYVAEKEVVLDGTEQSLSVVADAVEKLDFSEVPSYWREIAQTGVEVMRSPRMRLLKIHLAALLSNDWLPPPLGATAA